MFFIGSCFWWRGLFCHGGLFECLRYKINKAISPENVKFEMKPLLSTQNTIFKHYLLTCDKSLSLALENRLPVSDQFYRFLNLFNTGLVSFIFLTSKIPVHMQVIEFCMMRYEEA